MIECLSLWLINYSHQVSAVSTSTCTVTRDDRHRSFVKIRLIVESFEHLQGWFDKINLLNINIEKMFKHVHTGCIRLRFLLQDVLFYVYFSLNFFWVKRYLYFFHFYNTNYVMTENSQRIFMTFVKEGWRMIDSRGRTLWKRHHPLIRLWVQHQEQSLADAESFARTKEDYVFTKWNLFANAWCHDHSALLLWLVRLGKTPIRIHTTVLQNSLGFLDNTRCRPGTRDGWRWLPPWATSAWFQPRSTTTPSLSHKSKETRDQVAQGFRHDIRH